MQTCCADLRRADPVTVAVLDSPIEERSAVTMTLFTQLDAEWLELGVSAQAVTSLRIWARSDLPLQGFENLRDVVRFVQNSGLCPRGEQVLVSLATRASSDPLAARALLQVVLYGLIRIAADFRSATHSDEEAASVVVAIAYERIRTYPIKRRPRSIPTNILLDTRQGVSRSLCRRRVPELLTADIGGHSAEAPGGSAAEELLGLVHEAVRTRKLRVDDARLIVLTRVAGMSTAELAAVHGCAVQSLRRRRQRAEAVLAAAVRDVA